MLCHKAVRTIAKELAGCAYEDLAKNNLFYKKYPNQKKFISKFWGCFVAPARNALVVMLGQNYPEAMKEDMFEIIMKDRVLQDVQMGRESGRA